MAQLPIKFWSGSNSKVVQVAQLIHQSHENTSPEALGKQQYLARSSTAILLAQIAEHPNARQTFFDAVISQMQSSQTVTGLETVFLTLLNSLRSTEEVWARGVQVWTELAPKSRPNTVEAILFYDTESQTICKPSVNDIALIWQSQLIADRVHHWAGKLVQDAEWTIANPFKLRLRLNPNDPRFPGSFHLPPGDFHPIPLPHIPLPPSQAPPVLHPHQLPPGPQHFRPQQKDAAKDRAAKERKLYELELALAAAAMTAAGVLLGPVIVGGVAIGLVLQAAGAGFALGVAAGAVANALDDLKEGETNVPEDQGQTDTTDETAPVDVPKVPEPEPQPDPTPEHGPDHGDDGGGIAMGGNGGEGTGGFHGSEGTGEGNGDGGEGQGTGEGAGEGGEGEGTSTGDGPSGDGCFPFSTPVFTSLYPPTVQPIGTISVGDRVLGLHPDSPNSTPILCKVLRKFRHQVPETVTLHLGKDERKKILTTPRQRFGLYSKPVGKQIEFVTAQEIDLGTSLRTTAGEWETVSKIVMHGDGSECEVFNLTVEGAQTYFVGVVGTGKMGRMGIGARAGRTEETNNGRGMEEGGMGLLVHNRKINQEPPDEPPSVPT